MAFGCVSEHSITGSGQVGPHGSNISGSDHGSKLLARFKLWGWQTRQAEGMGPWTDGSEPPSPTAGRSEGWLVQWF